MSKETNYADIGAYRESLIQNLKERWRGGEVERGGPCSV